MFFMSHFVLVHVAMIRLYREDMVAGQRASFAALSAAGGLKVIHAEDRKGQPAGRFASRDGGQNDVDMFLYAPCMCVL